MKREERERKREREKEKERKRNAGQGKPTRTRDVLFFFLIMIITDMRVWCPIATRPLDGIRVIARKLPAIVEVLDQGRSKFIKRWLLFNIHLDVSVKLGLFTEHALLFAQHRFSVHVLQSAKRHVIVLGRVELIGVPFLIQTIIDEEQVV
jgi:hypothetical protein